VYNKDRKKRGEYIMKVTERRTVGYTVYATVVAEDNEVLTKENIENTFFFPFGGTITGMTDKIAHINYYLD
jgi:hypothetical protein